MAIATAEDQAFERRWHRVQRVGRAIVVLGLVLAVAGVFGTGPLAHATASGPGGSQIDYDRFVRTTQSTSIQVSPSGGGPSRVAIDQGYLQSIDLADVSPQPDSETARGSRLVLVYQGRLPSQIDLQLTPKTMGVHHGTIWVGDAAIGFRQVVWP